MATVTKSLIGGGTKVIQKVVIDWTSDGAGSATETVNLFGFLLKAVTDPDGTAAPTDLYDVTLVQDGVDMSGGIMVDRSATLNQVVHGLAKNGSDITPLPPFLAGDHTFTVANAGASKSGRVILYLSECL